MTLLSIFSVPLAVLAAALCLPIAVFCAEILAALAFTAQTGPLPRARPPSRKVAVLVPAHDESAMLLGTLANLRSELRPGDRILVVADNCTDDTADIAARDGAEVVERVDPNARGKSFALQFGLARLALDPPDVVVMVDADCRLAAGALDRLVSSCVATARPAQGCYLIVAPRGARASVRIAEFAQIVKNRLRPRGLQRLGLPCQLAGSGMAFPWSVVCAIDFRNGSIVEDLELGLAFAAAGHPPIFCEGAEITSEFPDSREGESAQRQRWQQGHLQTIAASVRKLPTALARRDFALAALMLDLIVPPFTLLVLMIGVTGAAGAVVAALGGSIAPLAISSAGFAALAAALAAGWRAAGTKSLALRDLRSLAGFMCARALAYPRFLTRKPVRWVRTDRGGPA